MNKVLRKSLAGKLGRTLSTHVELQGLLLIGHVVDPERLDDVMVVELMLDGVPASLCRADLFSERLASEVLLDPFHGFALPLSQAMFDTVSVAEVRLANDGAAIGLPLRLPSASRPMVDPLTRGQVRWQGGLRFTGWLLADTTGSPRVRGLIDDDQVVEASADLWTGIKVGAVELTVPAFTFHVPQRFADGSVHSIEVLTEAGERLPPGPVTFVAFDDGLERFLAGRSGLETQQLRGRLFDKLIPQSLPFDALEDWMARFPLPARAAAGAEDVTDIGVVLLGETGVEHSLESLEGQPVDWTVGVLPVVNGGYIFDPNDLLDFLVTDGARCRVLVFALAGTRFLSGALQRLAATLQDEPGAACVYGDIVLQRAGGAIPVGLPAFDLERLLEQGYCGWLFALRREAALAAVKAGAATLFELVENSLGPDLAGACLPIHAPGLVAAVPAVDAELATKGLAHAALQHCRRRGVEARPVEALGAEFPAVRLRRRQRPSTVSVIISVHNEAGALRRCLEAVRAQVSEHAIEILLVDNGSADAETRELLDSASDVRVLACPGPRNLARLCNEAVREARGDHLWFVDQHVEVQGSDALDELMSRLAGPHVGAVGGVLDWGSGGAVQDAGPVLNHRAGSSMSFSGCAVGDPAYAGQLLSARECTVVPLDFCLIDKRVFMAAGELDEIRFPLFFTAEALGMKLRTLGYRNIISPHARARRHRQDVQRAAEMSARYDRELYSLRTLWPERINDDLYYSPLLALSEPLYAALAWPPRSTKARRPSWLKATS